MRYNLDYISLDLSAFGVNEAELRRGVEELSLEFSTSKAPFLKVVTPQYVDEMVRYAERMNRISPRFKELVCVGIGGSSLGLKTIFHALLGLPGLTNYRYFFLENVDPQTAADVFNAISWDETLFVFISKSGRTLETVSLMNAVLSELKRRDLDPADRVMFISDPGSSFERLSEELKAPFFPIPEEIGGRYSVLTTVGLVPAEFFGLRALQFLEGAKRVMDALKDRAPWEHPGVALGYAKMWHYLKAKRNVSVMMIYSDRLRTFADWYAQLWAESLGKAKDRSGREVHVGQTPLPALGTVDQHSLLQLFMEGPDDKVYQMLKVKFPVDLNISTGLVLDYVEGKDLGQVMEAEFRGTVGALKEIGRPVAVLEVNELSPMALAELFTIYEIATYVASEVLKVNPYDQPGVELGKRIAREILSS